MARTWQPMVVAVLLGACGPTLSGRKALVKGQAFIESGRVARACPFFERVVRDGSVPGEVFRPAARGLARCASTLGRLGWAIALTDEVRRKQGVSRAAYFRAFLALASGPNGRKQAISWFERVRSRGDRADALYRMGLLALGREDLARAEQHLRQALELGSGAGVRIALAKVCALSGRFVEARRQLGEALAEHPLVGDRFRGEAVAELIDDLEAEFALDVRKLRDRAAKLLDRDLPSQAVELLRGALDKGISHPAILALLGLAELRLGNDARAVAVLLRAVSAPHPSWTAQVVLGRLSLERGELKRARRYLEAAVQSHPFDREVQRSLAVVLSRLRLHGLAAGVWAHVVVLTGRSASSLRHWGEELGHSGRVDQALSVLEQAVQKAPKDGAGWMALGDMLMTKYRAVHGHGEGSAEDLYRRAKRAYLKALEARSGDPVVLTKLKGLGVDVAKLIR